MLVVSCEQAAGILSLRRCPPCRAGRSIRRAAHLDPERYVLHRTADQLPHVLDVGLSKILVARPGHGYRVRDRRPREARRDPDQDRFASATIITGRGNTARSGGTS
jgi:hypothetical protein